MKVPLSCSFSSADSACSLEGTGSQIVPLLACKLDMNSHLLSLGVSSGQQRSEDDRINEVDLILNRAGHFVATNEEKMAMTIYTRDIEKSSLQTGLAERATRAGIHLTEGRGKE